MTTLTLDIAPRWDQIMPAGRCAAEFALDHGAPPEVAEALFMVTCELLENANKYGTFNPPRTDIRLTVTVESHSVIVNVRNALVDRDEHLARLDRMIQWIRAYQDPFEAYVERMREVSSQSAHSQEDGLGLVRIAFEGRGTVDFMVDSDRELSVSVVLPR